jgi:hypothetical protein
LSAAETVEEARATADRAQKHLGIVYE